MTYKSVTSVIRGILTEEAPAEIVDTPETTEPSEPTAADIVAHKYLRRPLHHRMQIQNKIIDNA